MQRHEQMRDASRRGGFLGSIVVNAIMLYAAQHVLEWQIGWITPAWSDVLWVVDLTLEASIVVNALYLIFDASWFRNLGGAVSCGIAVLATWWLYVIYPFDFGSATANDLARFLLVLLMIATTIGMLATAIIAIVQFARGSLAAAFTPRR
jgi:hypothetical protein